MWTIIEKIFRRYDAKGEVKLDRILNNSILRKCSLLLCSFYFVLFIGGCKPDKNDVTQDYTYSSLEGGNCIVTLTSI